MLVLHLLPLFLLGVSCRVAVPRDTMAPGVSSRAVGADADDAEVWRWAAESPVKRAVEADADDAEVWRWAAESPVKRAVAADADDAEIWQWAAEPAAETS